MSAYSDAVLADSPSAYWRLGESSGTSIADSSGNGKTGTLSSSMPPGSAASLLSADTANTAIQFDPTATLGPIVMDSTLVAGTQPITVEFWIKPSDLSPPSGFGMPVAGANSGSNGWCVYFPATTGVWHFLCQSGTDAAFSSSLAAQIGVTQHVVFTMTSGTLCTLYINGAFQQSIATGGIAGTTATVSVGEQGDHSHPCKAVIDEVAIYPTDLSAARILAHFQAATQAANRQVVGWSTRSGGY